MKQPKLRIRKVFQKVLENGGKGLGKAMIEEGYSPASATTPQKMTETKSWEMLLEEYLPDSLLTKTAQEGLKSMIPDKVLPDMPTRRQYLETVLKMKKKIGEGDENKKITIEINFVDEKKNGTEDSA